MWISTKLISNLADVVRKRQRVMFKMLMGALLRNLCAPGRGKIVPFCRDLKTYRQVEMG